MCGPEDQEGLSSTEGEGLPGEKDLAPRDKVNWPGDTVPLGRGLRLRLLFPLGYLEYGGSPLSTTRSYHGQPKIR